MSSEWPVVLVEDVCELIVDCVNKTAPVVSYETRFRMVRTTNIREGRVSLDSCRFVDEATYEKWTRRAKLQYGDVLLTREAPIGEVGFVDMPEGLFLGQRIMQYRANPKVLHPRFLHYVFQSPSLKHQFGSHEGSGSVVSHIRVGDCFKFKIPLPPTDVQDGVARLLGALDDRITLLRETNATLEAIAQALFKSWFVDFDPVRAKAEGRQPEGMDATTAALFPDSFEESELGLVPEGWMSRPIYDMATYINGAAYKAFEPNAERRGLPIIKIAELKAGVSAQTAFSDVAMPAKYLIETGDILFSWSGNPDTSIDTFVWQHAPALLNQHIFRVLPHEAFERSFVLQMLRNLKPVFAELARNKQTTGLGHVTVADLKRLRVVHPPQKVIEQFNTLAVPIHQMIFGNEQRAQTLTQLRDTLLPRLISGQLRLPESAGLLNDRDIAQ
ncbi:restriction endonuclease subunit S [Stutzerimonas stutzeri]|uniref:restriction endonuclease subunit S n=1 Tax=Stutzerimonas stutzeri TaxID=316 RepID=UPI0022DE23D7|nr:restriction endonuclease subunit S [Stutzerimonas stutzeri]WBL61921.1 restriction endonuclease subunit S [Stutzerimonas stutzeri]